MTAASNNFLIPNGTLIVEVIAFLLILLVVARYGLPRLNAAMQERQGRIKDELEAADRARAEALAADDERRQALEDARHQAREIVAQANHTSEQVQAESRTRAQEEYDRIVGGASHDIELARQRAVAEATDHLGEMVISVVEAIIGREVDAEAHRDLIEEAIAALASESRVPGGGSGS